MDGDRPEPRFHLQLNTYIWDKDNMKHNMCYVTDNDKQCGRCVLRYYNFRKPLITVVNCPTTSTQSRCEQAVVKYIKYRPKH